MRSLAYHFPLFVSDLGAVSWEKEDNISREGKDIQRLSKQLSDLDTKENLLEKKVKKGLMKVKLFIVHLS